MGDPAARLTQRSLRPRDFAFRRVVAKRTVENRLKWGLGGAAAPPLTCTFVVGAPARLLNTRTEVVGLLEDLGVYAQVRAARRSRRRSHQKGGGRRGEPAPAPPGSDRPPRARLALPTLQRQHRLGPAEVRQLAVAYRRGSTVALLARQFEVHPNTVLDHLKRAGVARRPCVRKLTDELVAQAAALHEAGWSYKQLGQRYHVDAETVRKEVWRLRRLDPSGVG